jgi:hypothetical protein
MAGNTLSPDGSSFSVAQRCIEAWRQSGSPAERFERVARIATERTLAGDYRIRVDLDEGRQRIMVRYDNASSTVDVAGNEHDVYDGFIWVEGGNQPLAGTFIVRGDTFLQTDADGAFY